VSICQDPGTVLIMAKLATWMTGREHKYDIDGYGSTADAPQSLHVWLPSGLPARLFRGPQFMLQPRLNPGKGIEQGCNLPSGVRLSA